jgi:hypothetical protein
MIDKLVGIIIAIILGFALISSGISALGTNLIMGIGLIIAGIAAIAFGIGILK